MPPEGLERGEHPLGVRGVGGEGVDDAGGGRAPLVDGGGDGLHARLDPRGGVGEHSRPSGGSARRREDGPQPVLDATTCGNERAHCRALDVEPQGRQRLLALAAGPLGGARDVVLDLDAVDLGAAGDLAPAGLDGGPGHDPGGNTVARELLGGGPLVLDGGAQAVGGLGLRVDGVCQRRDPGGERTERSLERAQDDGAGALRTCQQREPAVHGSHGGRREQALVGADVGDHEERDVGHAVLAQAQHEVRADGLERLGGDAVEHHRH